jgi:hypothetical protein
VASLQDPTSQVKPKLGESNGDRKPPSAGPKGTNLGVGRDGESYT